MLLTPQKAEENLDILFDESVCMTDDNRILISALAFQELVLHFVALKTPAYKGLIRIDNTKLGMMLKRFYRDINAVSNLANKLHRWVEEGRISPALAKDFAKEVKTLGVRINSARPKKTRIAAAFSLWMSTFRPIVLVKLPAVHKERAWRLDATINFWLATSFLNSYGDIKIGDPANDPEDYHKRINRIWYDFTFRDLNLSSLEFMYAFIFVPDPALVGKDEEDGDLWE